MEECGSGMQKVEWSISMFVVNGRNLLYIKLLLGISRARIHLQSIVIPSTNIHFQHLRMQPDKTGVVGTSKAYMNRKWKIVDSLGDVCILLLILGFCDFLQLLA